jgi:hypothetical protein
MEPERSAPCLQDPATGSYPEPDESNWHPKTISFKIYFNILPSTPRSLERSLSFRLSKKFVHTSHLPLYLICPAQTILLDFITLECLAKS